MSTDTHKVKVGQVTQGLCSCSSVSLRTGFGRGNHALAVELIRCQNLSVQSILYMTEENSGRNIQITNSLGATKATERSDQCADEIPKGSFPGLDALHRRLLFCVQHSGQVGLARPESSRSGSERCAAPPLIPPLCRRAAPRP